MHNLSLGSIPMGILQYLETGIPGFSNEIKDAIQFEGLNLMIKYNSNKEPINVVADITPDRQINIYENYIGYLWCLCLSLVTVYNEKQKDIRDEVKLNEAFKLLNYGISLKEKWKSWPEDLPDPSFSENQNVSEANAITIMAMSFILIHEFSHHALGHDLDKTNDHSEEYYADNFAFQTMIKGYIVGNDTKNHSINVGIIIGLGSILLLDSSWETDNEHPAIDLRLTKILLEFENINENNDKYWLWGVIILYLWNWYYFSNNLIIPKEKTAKESYHKFVELLRDSQSSNI
jgi:hypothetical protein